MTSILSGIKGHRPDSIATLSRLYSTGPNPIVGAKLQNDVLVNVDLLIATLTGKGNGRATTFRILATMVQSLHKSPEVEGRLYAVVDRISTLLESVVQSSDESEGFLVLLGALLESGSEEMLTRLNKVLPKLTACACRLCDKEATVLFGLSVLSLFSESKSRMLLNPSSAIIRKACLQAFDHPIHYSTAAHVLALQNSSETPENWMTNWSSINVECVRLVQLLGIKVNVDKASMAKVLPMIPSNHKILKLHGIRKALATERALRGCCEALQEMLRNGCTSGAVSIDLTYLLPLLSSILTLNIDSLEKDAKSSVENECGVSPSDLQAVIIQIKIYCVGVLSSLMETQTQSLLTVCSALCRPLASILAGKYVQASADLCSACLRCLSAAFKCFPTSITRDAKSGVLVLIDLFQESVRSLTAVRSSVLTAGDSADNSSSHCAQDTQVFETVEMLLLFCGPTLPTAVREEIETGVARVLSTLSKGLLTPQRSDRRMHRVACETVRENPIMQGCVLRLAYAEVFSCQRDGVLSGNACLLKRVSEMMAMQAGCSSSNSNSCEARRALLALEALLNPSSVSLPAVPSATVAKRFLTNRNTSVTAPADLQLGVEVDSLSSDASNRHDDVAEVVHEEEQSTAGVSTRTKRGRDDEDGGGDEGENGEGGNKRAKKDELKSFVPNPSIGAAFGVQGKKSGGANTGEEKDDDDDDDDDDSLPDINIEADPEK